jgi:hypothetical protein
MDWSFPVVLIRTRNIAWEISKKILSGRYGREYLISSLDTNFSLDETK